MESEECCVSSGAESLVSGVGSPKVAQNLQQLSKDEPLTHGSFRCRALDGFGREEDSGLSVAVSCSKSSFFGLGRASGLCDHFFREDRVLLLRLLRLLPEWAHKGSALRSSGFAGTSTAPPEWVYSWPP